VLLDTFFGGISSFKRERGHQERLKFGLIKLRRFAKKKRRVFFSERMLPRAFGADEKTRGSGEGEWEAEGFGPSQSLTVGAMYCG